MDGKIFTQKISMMQKGSKVAIIPLSADYGDSITAIGVPGSLSPPTLEMIDRYVKEFRENTDTKAMWTGEYGRLKPAVVRKLVKEAGIASGVPQLHPHAMSHYCATRLLKMGVDMRKVQVHLGHGSIKSTQRYTHMLSSDVQGEIYDLYSGVQEHDFFEYEEAIAI